MLQKTIAKSVSYTGNALFSGVEATITLHPAIAHHGVVFQRVDLVGTPTIPATVEHIFHTDRTTILGDKECQVQMVEHLLASLRSHQIDNVLIEIDNDEVPAGDGSAVAYEELIQKAGVVEQKEERKISSLKEPVYLSEKDIHLIALPSDRFQVSYTLSYPGHPLLNAQFFSYETNPETFGKEIAPARTFALYEEVLFMQEKGLLKGGTLDRGVVVKGEEVLNPDGLRFPEEMARHKILDLLGDISLVGMPFNAHILAVKSGHETNVSFAKKIVNALK